MKIENSGLNPVSPKKKAEEAHKVDQHVKRSEMNQNVRSKDKAEFSESARLLSKAHIALSELNEEESVKLYEIKQAVQSGDYSMPMDELVGRLVRYFKS